MKLGVISDTHDRTATALKALEYFRDGGVVTVFHAGDWKLLATVQAMAETANRFKLSLSGVLGNNDLDVTGFLTYAIHAPGNFHLQTGVLEYVVDGKRLAVYHGHHAPTLRRVRADQNYDIVLLGHTHKPKVEQLDGRLVVNPGSTAFAIPRRREWQPTVALVDTETMSAEIITLS